MTATAEQPQQPAKAPQPWGDYVLTSQDRPGERPCTTVHAVRGTVWENMKPTAVVTLNDLARRYGTLVMTQEADGSWSVPATFNSRVAMDPQRAQQLLALAVPAHEAYARWARP